MVNQAVGELHERGDVALGWQWQHEDVSLGFFRKIGRPPCPIFHYENKATWHSLFRSWVVQGYKGQKPRCEPATPIIDASWNDTSVLEYMP